MKEKLLTHRFLFVSGLIVLAAALRLVPHFENVTPIAAVALLGAAYFEKKWAAFLVPLTAMFISDAIIGFHDLIWAVYLSFAVIVAIGFLLRNNTRLSTVVMASVGGSVIFFIITNFGVWLTGTMYPMTLEGFISCYAAAVPFFRNMLFGDLFFAGVLFGAYDFVKVKYPVLVKSSR